MNKIKLRYIAIPTIIGILATGVTLKIAYNKRINTIMNIYSLNHQSQSLKKTSTTK